MRLELLAPAKDAGVARQAILHGADAVYIGGPTHGARAAAANSIADIRELAAFAHQYGARVYVTFNTIIYDSEIAAAEQQAWQLWQAGVDALIVQDMGLLRMRIPPIALHASTQCDIRSPRKAAFLAQCGFSQLVLPRELTREEIAQMREAVPASVALEAFVHGALCVSYSGDCHASCMANGRSANRGECAQMCRMAYDLTDADGNVLARDKHLLSLRDLCRLTDLEAMAEAGVSSFKIEGRLKDEAYVKNAVWAYRQALDRLIAAHPDRYQRASWGREQVSFQADVAKAFNRGCTSYFFNGVSRQPMGMVNFNSPKWIGEKVGTVTANKGAVLTAALTAELNNGDGLGYFDKSGQLVGFRLNRIDGNKLFPATRVDARPGDTLYRNRDVARDAALSGDTATRALWVDMELRSAPGLICLKVIAESGAAAETSILWDLQPAKSSQLQPRQRVLSKLGDTVFTLRNLADSVGDDQFVPASALADLRRKAIALLQSAMRATYAYEKRLPEDTAAQWPLGDTLTYHANVANALAAEFYRSHGVTDLEPAIEIQKPTPTDGRVAMTTPKANPTDGRVAMTTRYCLRREMGACLRSDNSKSLPADLYLQNRAARYRLHFDCPRCQMQLITEA